MKLEEMFPNTIYNFESDETLAIMYKEVINPYTKGLSRYILKYGDKQYMTLSYESIFPPNSRVRMN